MGNKTSSSVFTDRRHIHPNLFPKNPTPPNPAVTPVKTINPPYPLPYPSPTFPFHVSPSRSASLNGPEATAPTPLAALIIPINNPISTVGSSPLTIFITPALVLTNPPAKNPYTMAKTMSSGNAVERPQNRKTEMVAPTEQRTMTVVTWKRSQSIPINTVATTPAAFSSATNNVPTDLDSPSELANVGRYRLGMKYPKDSITSPNCKSQNEGDFRNPSPT